MASEPIEKLRAICLALPEATEKLAWGDPTFRVRDKIFVLGRLTGGKCEFWCKAPPGSQMVLVGADPERFYVPPYVGHRGWIGVKLIGDADWAEIRFIVERSYLMTAPKRLVTQFPEIGLTPRQRGII